MADYMPNERGVGGVARRPRSPEQAYEIPIAFYMKAETTNDQLTDEERALLLSRGDVVGKALAHPDSLTLEERYAAAYWSPPNALQPAIRQATDGAADTPEALYKLARSGPEFLAKHLSPEAQHILARRFQLETAPSNNMPFQRWIDVPGNGNAMHLILTRAGIDLSYLACMGAAEERAKRPAPWDADLDNGRLKKRLMTRDSCDATTGNPKWPPGHPPQLGESYSLFFYAELKLEAAFQDKLFEDVESEVRKRWQALNEEQRAAYVSRSEELRTKAWDEFDEDCARKARGSPDAGTPRMKLPGFDNYVERLSRGPREHIVPRNPSIASRPGTTAQEAEGSYQHSFLHAICLLYEPTGKTNL